MEAAKKELEEKYPDVQVFSHIEFSFCGCSQNNLPFVISLLLASATISTSFPMHLWCNRFQINVVVFDMAATMGEQPNSLTRIRSVYKEGGYHYFSAVQNSSIGDLVTH